MLSRLLAFLQKGLDVMIVSLPYITGSGITGHPVEANIVGYLSDETYLDLNDNDIQDPLEPTAAPALGEMAWGSGQIVFTGDTNMWQVVPQPLVDNTINWFNKFTAIYEGA